MCLADVSVNWRSDDDDDGTPLAENHRSLEVSHLQRVTCDVIIKDVRRHHHGV